MPQTRCITAGSFVRPRCQPPLPFGNFRSLRIKAFDWLPGLPVRLPDAPDFRSLPKAFHSLENLGSSFPIRYASVGLLFLKPLGTFLNMR